MHKNSPREELERTPEEAAFIMRLRVLVNMRWLAILGIIIATLVASNVFNIGFPVLPVYIICIFMALYNLLLFHQARTLRREKTGLIITKGRTYSDIHIFFDLLALTTLLHFTGGIENPFIFYFVLHIIAGSIIVHYRVVYLLATAAILSVTLLVSLEYAGIIPHVNLEGFASPTVYREGSYILAILVALATILYATTYMTTAISGELKKRQRQVVELGERLLQKKTSELEHASDEISKLERSSRRITGLMNLISDLLDIPRIETGQIVQEMKEISVREVVKHSTDELRNSAKEKGLKLKLELPGRLPKINGSSSRLQQVLTNLLSNAINYTPEGTVTVIAREEP